MERNMSGYVGNQGIDMYDPNRPDDIQFENAATMDDGKVTHLTIEPSKDGGFDVSVHPVTADGEVQYDIDIVSEHADAYDDAKEIFDAMREDWNTGLDHVDEYEQAMEDAGYSKEDIFVNDTFDPMSRYDTDNNEDSVSDDEDEEEALEDLIAGLDESLYDLGEDENGDVVIILKEDDGNDNESQPETSDTDNENADAAEIDNNDASCEADSENDSADDDDWDDDDWNDWGDSVD